MLGEPAEGAPSRQDVANLDLIEISDGLGSSVLEVWTPFSEQRLISLQG